jgi:succinate dehydrogenase/fumarate reductase flavoprotein subunit
MSDSDKTRPTQATRLSAISQWDIETDVIVVGFGGAGASAAIEAADGGANVHLFEVSSAAGGSTALSGGEVYLGGSGGTPIQRKFGFEDQTEDMITYLMMQQGPQADAEKIRAYVEGGVEHFGWLVDKGVPFKESFLDERVVEPTTDDCLIFSGNEKAWPEINHCKPAPRAHVVQMEGMGAGSILMQHLQKAVEDRGVTVHYDARVLSLIIDDNGDVVGAMVRIDSKELAVRASGGVILCAGGFVMNEEMVRQYAPKLTRCTMPTGNPGDTGTGIQMGMSVGAAAINMHEGFSSIPFYPPATITYGIVVTDKGQRFINEDAYHGRVGATLLEQAGERFFFIVDVDAYSNYEEFNFMSADVAGTGDSAEELEQELGLAAGSLSKTLDFYNAHAAKGEDPLFHKQPAWLRPLQAPYVALDITPGRGAFWPYFTLGGLDTKVSGEVLRADGTVINGLYAAGRNACGVPRRGAGYCSGISVGDATFSGRQAGRAAASRANA